MKDKSHSTALKSMVRNISSISLQASAASVWRAITLPEKVKLWQYGSELITSWHVGTEIRFRNEFQGQVFEQWGKVLQFEPNYILRYTLFFPNPGLEDKPENYFEMIYRITPTGDQTLLEIIKEDGRPGAIQEPDNGEKDPALQALKELVEAEKS